VTNCAVLSSIFFLHRAFNPEHEHDAGQVSTVMQRTCTNPLGKHRAGAQRRAEQIGAGPRGVPTAMRAPVDHTLTQSPRPGMAAAQGRAPALS
jgi:hypothetical protein